MVQNHKHAGVLTSSGGLRPHPLDRKHSDDKVKKEHNLSLSDDEKKKYLQPYKQTKAEQPKMTVSKVKETEDKNTVICGIDNEGFVNINLDKSDFRGIRVKFTRFEGRTRRTVGLQINNEQD